MEQHDELLLSRLQALSERIVGRSREVNGSLEQLASETRACSVRTKNALNQLLLLSNTQFVENRVYEEEEEEEDHDDEEARLTEEKEEDKSREPSDPKERWELALSLGIVALKQKVFYYYEDEEEEEDEDDEEAEDIYNSRPLPFIIGTRPYAASESAGIGEAVPDYRRDHSEDEEDEDEDTYEQVEADEMYDDGDEISGRAPIVPPPMPTTNTPIPATPPEETTTSLPASSIESSPQMPESTTTTTTVTGRPPPMPSSDLFAPEEEIFANNDDPYDLFGAAAPRRESRTDAGSLLFGQGGDLFDDGEEEPPQAEERSVFGSGGDASSAQISRREEPIEETKEAKNTDTFDELFGATSDDIFGSDSLFGNESGGRSDATKVSGKAPSAFEPSGGLFAGGLFGDDEGFTGSERQAPKVSGGLFDDEVKGGGLFFDDDPAEKRMEARDDDGSVGREGSTSLFSGTGGLFDDSGGGLFEDSTMSFAPPDEQSPVKEAGLFADDIPPSSGRRFFYEDDAPTPKNMFESPLASKVAGESSTKVGRHMTPGGLSDNPFDTPRTNADSSPHPISSGPLFEKPTSTERVEAPFSTKKKGGLEEKFGGLAIDPSKLLPGARPPPRIKDEPPAEEREETQLQQPAASESTLDTSTLASRPTVSGGKKRRPTTKKKFVADESPAMTNTPTKPSSSLVASKKTPTVLFARDVPADSGKTGGLFADREPSKAREPLQAGGLFFADEEPSKSEAPSKVGGLFAGEEPTKDEAPAKGDGLFADEKLPKSQERLKLGGLFADEEPTKNALSPSKVGGLFADEKPSKNQEPLKLGGLFADEEPPTNEAPAKAGGLFADEKPPKSQEPAQSGGLFADEEPSKPSRVGGLFSDEEASGVSDDPLPASNESTNIFASSPPKSSEVFDTGNFKGPKKDSFGGGGLFDDPPAGGGGLFDDTPATKRGDVKAKGGLFGDGSDDDVFGGGIRSSAAPASQNMGDDAVTSAKKPKSSGLFGDDEDDDDIFGSGRASSKGGLFG